jgi:hypothetical protein
MPRPTTGRRPVSVRLDPAPLAWLQEQAQRRQIELAECIRRIVDAAMKLDQGEPAPAKAPRDVAHAPLPVPQSTEEQIAAAGGVGIAVGSAGHEFRASQLQPLRCATCGVKRRHHL